MCAKNFSPAKFSFVLALTFCLSLTTFAAPVATVQALSGGASVLRGGAPVALVVAAVVSENETIKTAANGKLTLLFMNGSQLRINAGSTVRVTAPAHAGKGNTSFINVVGGEVWARLRPGQAVQTRSAIAGVRGTEFVLRVAADETTTVSVVEGEVNFHNDFGAVSVGESQQSVARPGSAPSQPVTIANPGLLVEWTFDLNRAVLPRETFFVSQDEAVIAKEIASRGEKVKANPADGAAQLALADALFDAGRFVEAVTHYNLAPRGGDAVLHLGNALLELGRLDEAEAQFRAVLNDAPQRGDALISLANLDLARGNPAEAQLNAQRTIAELPGPARLALGVALMRQPGRLEDAAKSLEIAVKELPATRIYEAKAWLALVKLSQDDTEGALKIAQDAVNLNPKSALAQGNFALVAVFAGKPREAKRAAEIAVARSPRSVAAKVALGQALLANGQTEDAETIAAQAVALDPQLPQSRYLLAVAQAGRRDYVHAERELKKSLQLAPEFLPAASALAHVYNAMDKPKQAEATLTALLPRHRNTDAVQGALGSVFYEQGNYSEAANQLRAALKKRPSSALYHGELTKALLYGNHLRAAIEAGREAVRLAPQVAQYHALLGLAYDFSGLTAQAERELHEALARDGNNALALARLADKHAGDARTARSSFTQGFLLDPAVPRQLMRGGVAAELTPNTGSDSQRDVGATHRFTLADGRIHTYGFVGGERTDGNRANADRHSYALQQFASWTPRPGTNLFASISGRNTRRGLAGPDAAPDLDDRQSLKAGHAQLAGRWNLSPRAKLWLGAFGNSSRSQIANPALDSFFSGAGFPVDAQRFKSHSFTPEGRVDFDLSRTPGQPRTLTFGLTTAGSRFTDARHLVGVGGATGDQVFDRRIDESSAYAQLAQRSGKLSLTGQLRAQRSRTVANETLTFTGLPPAATTGTTSRTLFLPSLLATYEANPKTTLRLFANRRAGEARSSLLAPTETLINTESSVLPFGTPDKMRQTQLDVERRLGARDYLKFFTFQTRATGVQIGGTDVLGFGSGLPAANAPLVNIGSWRGRGAGLRYERQLGANLFLNTGLTLRRTSNTSFGPVFPTIFSGGDAPYEPNRVAHLGFDYVSPHGLKLGLGLRHNGAFFADSPLALGRPKFPAKSYLDLKIAREPSAGQELFIAVTNVFNADAVQFNGFSTDRRRVVAGGTRRF